MKCYVIAFIRLLAMAYNYACDMYTRHNFAHTLFILYMNGWVRAWKARKPKIKKNKRGEKHNKIFHIKKKKNEIHTTNGNTMANIWHCLA